MTGVRSRFIEGRTVFLRPLEPADYGERMLRWADDREVTRYLVRGTYPLTREQHLHRYEELIASPTDLEMAIVSSDDDETVGVAGLHQIDRLARSAEFRVLIGERGRWGKGIGTEVLQLLVAYAFEVLNLNKVWLGVNEANEGAVKSYEKAGFEREGVLRQEIYRNGRYYDVVRMSILRNEYEDVMGSWPVLPEIQRQLRGSG